MRFFKYLGHNTGYSEGRILRKNNFLGVYGHTAIDIIYSSDEFPRPNTCVELKGRKEQYGGTGANVARIAASLGVPTALASHVGDDFPKEFMESLREEGVDTVDVVKVRGQRTPFVIMISDKGHNQIGFVEQGAVLESEKLPLRTHTVDSSQFVHVGTGRPTYMLKVARRAKRKKRTVCFDPAQELHYVYTPETFKLVLEQSDILFANSSELERAKEYLNLKDDLELLSYVKMVIHTKGADGSRILTADDDLIVGAIPPDKVTDTTGAGDAFRAGFYAGLSKSLPIEECAWIGASVASFVVESVGAQSALPSWDMVQRRAARRKYV
ncbi:MAG: carbohydrate kinase family protein [Thermoplasmata archaeon]|nr:carbohydrate kinase family protein [Thermoplasmata archaeon]MCJ7561420.1 carbohydrate kinase family protein [Thermoplasmata archaeon]TFG68440.1 MAG: carbohydrate kinase family protein [Methanomassiliicoccus sp.]